MKQKKITSTMQKVAVDILQDIEIYMMTHKTVPDEISALYDRVFEKYELCRDPFTYMACTTKEYFENHLEYEKQCMMERYGHCDGLD